MDSTLGLYVLGVAFLIALLWLASQWMHGRHSLQEIREVVGTLVEAAEQMMPGETGEDKLSYVLAKADELGLTKYVHPTLLRAMIESSVYWLSQPSRADGIVHE